MPKFKTPTPPSPMSFKTSKQPQALSSLVSRHLERVATRLRTYAGSAPETVPGQRSPTFLARNALLNLDASRNKSNTQGQVQQYSLEPNPQPVEQTDDATLQDSNVTSTQMSAQNAIDESLTIDQKWRPTVLGMFDFKPAYGDNGQTTPTHKLLTISHALATLRIERCLLSQLATFTDPLRGAPYQSSWLQSYKMITEQTEEFLRSLSFHDRALTHPTSHLQAIKIMHFLGFDATSIQKASNTQFLFGVLQELALTLSTNSPNLSGLSLKQPPDDVLRVANVNFRNEIPLALSSEDLFGQLSNISDSTARVSALCINFVFRELIISRGIVREVLPTSRRARSNINSEYFFGLLDVDTSRSLLPTSSGAKLHGIIRDKDSILTLPLESREILPSEEFNIDSAPDVVNKILQGEDPGFKYKTSMDKMVKALKLIYDINGFDMSSSSSNPTVGSNAISFFNDIVISTLERMIEKLENDDLPIHDAIQIVVLKLALSDFTFLSELREFLVSIENEKARLQALPQVNPTTVKKFGTLISQSSTGQALANPTELRSSRISKSRVSRQPSALNDSLNNARGSKQDSRPSFNADSALETICKAFSRKIYKMIWRDSQQQHARWYADARYSLTRESIADSLHSWVTKDDEEGILSPLYSNIGTMLTNLGGNAVASPWNSNNQTAWRKLPKQDLEDLLLFATIKILGSFISEEVQFGRSIDSPTELNVRFAIGGVGGQNYSGYRDDLVQLKQDPAALINHSRIADVQSSLQMVIGEDSGLEETLNGLKQYFANIGNQYSSFEHVVNEPLHSSALSYIRGGLGLSRDIYNCMQHILFRNNEMYDSVNDIPVKPSYCSTEELDFLELALSLERFSGETGKNVKILAVGLPAGHLKLVSSSPVSLAETSEMQQEPSKNIFSIEVDLIDNSMPEIPMTTLSYRFRRDIFLRHINRSYTFANYEDLSYHPRSSIEDDIELNLISDEALKLYMNLVYGLDFRVETFLKRGVEFPSVGVHAPMLASSVTGPTAQFLSASMLAPNTLVPSSDTLAHDVTEFVSQNPPRVRFELPTPVTEDPARENYLSKSTYEFLLTTNAIRDKPTDFLLKFDNGPIFEKILLIPIDFDDFRIDTHALSENSDASIQLQGALTADEAMLTDYNVTDGVDFFTLRIATTVPQE